MSCHDFREKVILMNVYWNGEVVPQEQAKVNPLDRGFLLGDGIYEVVRIYQGMAFELEAHQERFDRSAQRIGLLQEYPRLKVVLDALMAQQSDQLMDGMLYLQTSRGVAPRKHFFPNPPVAPSTFGFLSPLPRPDLMNRAMARSTSVDDRRWLDCDIKSISLLGAVMAAQKAQETGSVEAILHRDGRVTEGSHTNVFAVIDGVLRTHPPDHWILNGITRQVVVQLARSRGMSVLEDAVTLEELRKADELFLTGTTVEILPVSHLDGLKVGGQAPGELTCQLMKAFNERVSRKVDA